MSWLMVCPTKSWFHVYFYDSLYCPLWHNNAKPGWNLELIPTSHHQIATTFPTKISSKFRRCKVSEPELEIFKNKQKHLKVANNTQNLIEILEVRKT